MKELSEPATLNNFRNKFELVRSFDLEDDMDFIPNLLSLEEVSRPTEQSACTHQLCLEALG